MAMSDCIHCLSTPCECGSEYKDWNIERLIEFRNTIQSIIDDKLRIHIKEFQK